MYTYTIMSILFSELAGRGNSIFFSVNKLSLEFDRNRTFVLNTTTANVDIISFQYIRWLCARNTIRVEFYSQNVLDTYFKGLRFFSCTNQTRTKYR